MQYSATPQARSYTAEHASVDERASFLVKTYVHLVAAIFAFVLLETALFMSGAAGVFMQFVFTVPMSWFIVIGLFIGAGFVANRWAHNVTSPGLAYAGLGLYVLVEAVIFVPLIGMALMYSDGMTGVLPSAALVTVLLFSGLTAIVLVTRKDFSFMRGILGVAALGALGVIVCSMIFGFNLGILFSGAMVVLAGGYTLYYTSNVLHHYRTDQHVAASLALFSAIALMFYYVLSIFMSRR